jgi:flagellar biosynthetic protein FliR
MAASLATGWLADWLAGAGFGFLVIFARVGAVVTALPGFSAVYVSIRIRLIIALAVSLLLLPLIAEQLPKLPASPAALMTIIVPEIIVGVFIGLIPRIIVAALHMAGTFTALSVSLANALVQDPVADQQSSTLSGFFAIVGLVLIFVTDLHHLMLEAIVHSYTVFPVGMPLPLGDFADALTTILGQSMALGLQLSAPFVLVGFIYNFGLGLLGRLMPQLPVFFFGMPIQISLQIWALMLTLSGIMLVFLTRFGDLLAPFAGR